MDGLEGLAGLGRQLEGVALGAVDDRAEKLSPAGGMRRDQRRPVLAGQVLGQGRLGRSGVAELEGEHHGPLTDPEGREAVANIVRRQAAGEGRSEDLAGEPALGLHGHAIAHQLEGDDDRGLLHTETLEVAQFT